MSRRVRLGTLRFEVFVDPNGEVAVEHRTVFAPGFINAQSVLTESEKLHLVQVRAEAARKSGEFFNTTATMAQSKGWEPKL